MKPDKERVLMLHWPDGRPLYAGDIPKGSVVSFDRRTGLITSVKPDTRRKRDAADTRKR